MLFLARQAWTGLQSQPMEDPKFEASCSKFKTSLSYIERSCQYPSLPPPKKNGGKRGKKVSNPWL